MDECSSEQTAKERLWRTTVESGGVLGGFSVIAWLLVGGSVDEAGGFVTRGARFQRRNALQIEHARRAEARRTAPRPFTETRVSSLASPGGEVAGEARGELIEALDRVLDGPDGAQGGVGDFGRIGGGAFEEDLRSLHEGIGHEHLEPGQHADEPFGLAATLRAARNAGLPVFVALAPTYPECDEADLRSTLRAVAELAPITVFHEPINIRAENVARIAGHAQVLGGSVNTDVFAPRESWLEYALNALQTVERLAAESGLADRLHLWPDKSLGSQAAVQHLSARTGLAPDQFRQWLHRWWNRLSEWPSRSTTTAGH